jgi:methylenetetrahydrofolate dehydrogenase (NADP+)/methenyltetrahydrofolate cyclohydrolase
VGKPVALLLLAQDATVTICHSKTSDLAQVCRQADVLVAACGQPEMVKGDWVKAGAVVIDVGTTRVEKADGSSGLKGDVQFDAAFENASLITPVPGGVGPMTIAMLLVNTHKSFEMRMAAQVK